MPSKNKNIVAKKLSLLFCLAIFTFLINSTHLDHKNHFSQNYTYHKEFSN